MREFFLIFILFFCLVFTLNSYVVEKNEIVKVKVFNFILNQQKSFEELEKEISLFVQKVGSNNVLSINHKILFTGVEVVVIVIYKSQQG
ncbi:hypothetical protein [Borreliella lusitaniae]|uniref:hypothetical protein n=1 Tax=Borreliella lusitaniae TaxID=100177 RepID=UPI002931CCC8|nr:hypothetical protein [Borreliella lusitaniae]WNY67326.1 hypothetical protein QIA40_04915 [Borreliella lusitaniae]